MYNIHYSPALINSCTLFSVQSVSKGVSLLFPSESAVEQVLTEIFLENSGNTTEFFREIRFGENIHKAVIFQQKKK